MYPHLLDQLHTQARRVLIGALARVRLTIDITSDRMTKSQETRARKRRGLSNGGGGGGGGGNGSNSGSGNDGGSYDSHRKRWQPDESAAATTSTTSATAPLPSLSVLTAGAVVAGASDTGGLGTSLCSTECGVRMSLLTLC